MYALVDGNNFYVSCERVFRPSLRGRPVIVLSNNDGCAIARSNEAKALGIAMAEPWPYIRQRLGDAGVVALSANFTLYGDMSNRMMAIAAGLGLPRDPVDVGGEDQTDADAGADGREAVAEDRDVSGHVMTSFRSFRRSGRRRGVMRYSGAAGADTAGSVERAVRWCGSFGRWSVR